MPQKCIGGQCTELPQKLAGFEGAALQWVMERRRSDGGKEMEGLGREGVGRNWDKEGRERGGKLSSFKFVQWAPKDACFLQQIVFWLFKVIQGR